MEYECDQIPDTGHLDCKLNEAEEAVAAFFEAGPLRVIRLCVNQTGGSVQVPDFELRDAAGAAFLCEVKELSTAQAALSPGDWRYRNRSELRHIQELARNSEGPVLVPPGAWARGQNEIRYPLGGRNTDLLEEANRQTIERLLREHLNGSLSFEIIIDCGDSFNWLPEEVQAFAATFADQLKQIMAGQLPRAWEEHHEIVCGDYLV